MTLGLKGTLSVLLCGSSVLTLYVKEKVGANEGAYHHRNRQSTVRHHLSDFAIQVRAVKRKGATHIDKYYKFYNYLFYSNYLKTKSG